VRQDFAAQESFDAPFFQQWNLLYVAEFRVRLVLDDHRLTFDCARVQTTQRVRLGLPRFVDS
jgi:hypothetical protein